MATNYGAYGGAISSVWSTFSTSMAIDAQNDAVKAEAQRNIEIYEADLELTKFAQTNNSARSQQILTQLEGERAESLRDIQVQETEAIGQEVARRGSGITAGTSVSRSVDDVIKKGAAAKNKTADQFDDRMAQTISAASAANAQEQAGLIQSYNDMVNKNQQLAGKVISGASAAFQIAQSGIGGFIKGQQTGQALGESGALDNISNLFGGEQAPAPVNETIFKPTGGQSNPFTNQTIAPNTGANFLI